MSEGTSRLAARLSSVPQLSFIYRCSFESIILILIARMPRKCNDLAPWIQRYTLKLSSCTSIFGGRAGVISFLLNLVVILIQFEKVPAQLNNSIVNSSFQESSIHNGVSSSHPSPSIPVQVCIQTKF